VRSVELKLQTELPMLGHHDERAGNYLADTTVLGWVREYTLEVEERRKR